MARILRKTLALVSSAAIAASMITVPVTASAEGELKSWKFDFGSADDVANGYIGVTADVNYTLNTSGDDQYGFIGTNSKDYKLNGGHIDGFVQQEGQVIELTAGGGTGLNDGIGSTGVDKYGNAGDKYYPVRFALKVPENTYYRVKATVTTFDASKPATASLYTERKHPLYTEKTIPAGEIVTTEFTVRPTPIYYKGPSTQYADEMVNVCVLGENTAFAALEVEQIETAPVLWVLGDSTVTDGGGSLPFFPLQNYTGVGTGLTKYLPSDIAMVNEGEGGLDAHDNQHFNMVKNRIKAGDYMYVEYGHNHKSDGSTGYIQCLDKYWQACKDVGATLILVGPIDRINNYDSSTNTWSTSLAQYSRAAKGYVDTMRYGGEDAANTYVSTYVSSGEAAAETYKAEVLAANTEVQISNIAFVDLNEPSLRFYETRTANGVVNDTEYTNTKALMNYYFCTKKNGSTDASHPNDTGAENLAYRFFTTADTAAYPALKPLLANFDNDAAHEEPTLVSPEIINMGWAGRSDAWPTYVTVSYDYPLVIKQLVTDDDGNVTGMKVYKQDAMETYSSGVIEVGNTKYVTQDHIDNTWDNKNTYEITFAEPVTLEDGYKAYMWSCSMDEERLLTEDEGGVRHSSDYVPAEYDAYMLPGDEDDIETFDYYGKTDLIATGKYTFKGSTGSDFTLGEDDGRTYANIISTGGGTSYWLYRKFENLSNGTGTNGRYIIETDIKYNSGYNGNSLRVAFAPSITNNSPYVNAPYELFTIGANGAITVKGASVGSLTALNWTNVRYILDMNAGTASVSINGSDAKVVDLPEYATFETPSIGSMNYVAFTTATRSATFDTQFSNLAVAKIADDGSTKTIDVAVDSESEEMGTVYTGEAGTTSQSVPTSSSVTATAAANEGYSFVGWYEGDTLFSDEESISIARLYRDLSLTAKFRLNTEPARITINYTDEEGNTIKPSDIITEDDGKPIYSQTAFALADESYTAAVKKQLANGMYNVYMYNSEKSDPLSIDSLAVENTINLVFTKLDDVYYDYEDFSDPAVGTWGFVNETSYGNGVLNLLTKAGDKSRSSSYKNLDESILAADKLIIRFDWLNKAASRRNSLFDLYDSDGTYIFSMNASGGAATYNIGAAGNAEGNAPISGSVSENWHRVVLDIDFSAGTLSGAITDLTTNAVTAIEETAITAKNLAKMQATYGYSTGDQYLDNVGISRARTEDDVEPEPTTYNVTFTGDNAMVKIDGESVTEYTAEENSTISFTVEADEGYVVTAVTVNDEEIAEAGGVYSFVLTDDVAVVISTAEETKEPIEIKNFGFVDTTIDGIAAQAEVANHQSEAVTVQVLVALYSGDVLRRVALETKTIEPGAAETVFANAEITTDEITSYKAFLWNAENYKPFADVLTPSAE